MSHIRIESTERSALDAARAEGRSDAAQEIERLVGTWFAKFAELVGDELDDVGRTRVLQFRAALAETLARKVEEYRIEQSRSLDRYVAARREVAAVLS